MHKKTISVASMLMVALSVLMLASCSNRVDTTKEDIIAGQKEEKILIVQIVAYNCRVCEQQEQIIKEFLKNNPNLKGHVHYMRVDFYQDKELHLAPYYFDRPSTLVIYKGVMEINRSVGETNPVVMGDFLINSITNPVPRQYGRAGEYTPKDVLMHDAAKNIQNNERTRSNATRENAMQQQAAQTQNQKNNSNVDEDSIPYVDETIGE